VKGEKTRADYLAEASARQPVDGLNSKFCRASHAQLAQADAMIGYRLDPVAQAAHRAAFQAKWAAIAAGEKIS
jgi:hypothetical protein